MFKWFHFNGFYMIIVFRKPFHIQKMSWHPMTCCHGPPARYVKLRVAHTPEIPGTFSPPPCVSDPDMHHGMCGFVWSRWRGNRSRHSRWMRNPQFYVSGDRPMSSVSTWFALNCCRPPGIIPHQRKETTKDIKHRPQHNFQYVSTTRTTIYTKTERGSRWRIVIIYSPGRLQLPELPVKTNSPTWQNFRLSLLSAKISAV